MDDSGETRPGLVPAYGSALCIAAQQFGSVLTNLGFYVRRPERNWKPDMDAFEKATRGDVHREYRLLSKLAQDPGLGPWLRRARRDPVEFAERLGSGKDDALSLITDLVSGGVWGRDFDALGDHPARASANQVLADGKWFKTLANALGEAIKQVEAERQAIPGPAREEALDVGADPEPTRSDTPDVKPVPSAATMSKDAQAVALLAQWMDEGRRLNLTEFAKALGVPRQELYVRKRFPKFTRLRESLRADVRKGRKEMGRVDAEFREDWDAIDDRLDHS